MSIIISVSVDIVFLNFQKVLNKKYNMIRTYMKLICCRPVNYAILSKAMYIWEKQQAKKVHFETEVFKIPDIRESYSQI